VCEDPTEEAFKADCLYFTRTGVTAPGDWQSMAYLLDYPVDSNPRQTFAGTSHRSVGSHASCDMPKKATVFNDTALLIAQGNGTWTPLLWNGPKSWNITTWAAGVEDFCGPRCTNVRVLVPTSDSHATDEEYEFYRCNSTVDEISTPNYQAQETFESAPDKQIPDSVAQVFAGAIGWGEQGFDGDPFLYTQNTQSQTFVTVTHNSSEEIGRLISLFSMFSIAVMDYTGARTNVTGYPPRMLQTLDVQWFWVNLALMGLPVAQLLMVIIIAVLSTRAVIKDTTFIAAAQLLKPALDDLGSQGSILSGDEIADHAGDVRLCYGVRRMGGSGGYYIDVIYQAERIEHQRGTAWRPGQAMPEGLYDGPETK